jgi:hypothetical protein
MLNYRWERETRHEDGDAPWIEWHLYPTHLAPEPIKQRGCRACLLLQRDGSWRYYYQGTLQQTFYSGERDAKTQVEAEISMGVDPGEQKVYLAARYSRHTEMQDYRSQLEPLGYRVTSRWIDGGHEWVGTPDEEMPLEVGIGFAYEDLEDLNAAEIVICFTEEPRATATRGGRHVEFGYALAKGMEIIVVGYRENVFYTVPAIKFFETWEEALAHLDERKSGEPVGTRAATSNSGN